jgi:hypothetical protein
VPGVSETTALRDDGPPAPEQRVEQRGLARVRRPGQHADGPVRGRLGGARRGEQRVDLRGDLPHALEQVTRRDGDDVLLVGEVDAGLDQRERRGDLVGEAPVGVARPPVEECAGGLELGVIAGGDERLDALGLLGRQLAREESAGGELAGLGQADTLAQRQDVLEQAVGEVRVAREEDLGGVLAGVGVGRAEDHRERGEGCAGHPDAQRVDGARVGRIRVERAQDADRIGP